MYCGVTVSEYPHFVMLHADCFTWVVEHIMCVYVRMLQTSCLSYVGGHILVAVIVDCAVLRTGWAADFVGI